MVPRREAHSPCSPGSSHLAVEPELTPASPHPGRFQIQGLCALLEPGLCADQVLTPAFWLLQHVLNRVPRAPPRPATDPTNSLGVSPWPYKLFG